MKRNLFIIVLLSGLFLQVSAQRLRLHGTVPGRETGKVYLQKFIDRYYEVADSAEIKGGAFSFNTQVELPEVYGISLSLKDTPFLVFLDEGDLSVTLHATLGYRGSQIQGSALHDLYIAFHSDQQGDISSFIKANPQSLAPLYILYREQVSRLSSEEIQANLNLIDPSLQQHRFAQILRDVIKTREKTDVGQQAPDFSAITPEGQTVSLRDFLGKGYLLLDFWASWCGPCRKENPNIVAAYGDYKDHDFDILAVSLDKTREAWLQGIEQDHLDYHHVSELKFWNSDIARLYGIRSIPSNLLLDKNGKIIAKNLRGNDLRETLKSLLGQ
jgi:peroxiredoxin